MLNESGSRTVQPSLPITSGAERRHVAAAGHGVTILPEWLREHLQELAAMQRPDATWDEVIIQCLVVGAGAMDGLDFGTRMTEDSAAKPAAAPVPAYPFERKHLPAFKALLAAVEAGPLTLDAASIESITGRMGSESLRGVGAFMATLARNSPVVGLSVEALGRKPGRVMMDYRISKAG